MATLVKLDIICVAISFCFALLFCALAIMNKKYSVLLLKIVNYVIIRWYLNILLLFSFLFYIISIYC